MTTHNFKAWYEKMLMEIHEPTYQVNPIISHSPIIPSFIPSQHIAPNPNLYHISYPSSTFDKGNPSYSPSISPSYSPSTYFSNPICVPPSHPQSTSQSPSFYNAFITSTPNPNPLLHSPPIVNPNSPIHYLNPPSNSNPNPNPPSNPNPPKSILSTSSKSIIHNLIQDMLAKETKPSPQRKVAKSPQVLHPPQSPPPQNKSQSPTLHDTPISPSTHIKASIPSSITQSHNSKYAKILLQIMLA